MSEPAHTPGPWVADATNQIFQAGTLDPIATVFGPQLMLEVEANANLIARAPEMAAEITTLRAEAEKLKADLDGYIGVANEYMAENERLLAVLALYREAVRIDVTMAGPKFAGSNASALKRAWDADCAALEEKP